MKEARIFLKKRNDSSLSEVDFDMKVESVESILNCHVTATSPHFAGYTATHMFVMCYLGSVCGKPTTVSFRQLKLQQDYEWE